MKKVFLTAVLTLIAMVFVSCEKTALDDRKPVIDLKAPTDYAAFKPGSDIHFDAVLTDNFALKSYKINIHGAFDGHKHSVARAGEDAVVFEKTWTEADFIKLGEIPIAGKKEAKLHHHHVVIPEKVDGKPIKEGHYHFMIYCTDEAGNETFVSREIEIRSDAEEHSHHH